MAHHTHSGDNRQTGPQGSPLPDRPDQYGHGVTIPVTTARRVELTADIMGDAEELVVMHSVLAQSIHTHPARTTVGAVLFGHYML